MDPLKSSLNVSCSGNMSNVIELMVDVNPNSLSQVLGSSEKENVEVIASGENNCFKDVDEIFMSNLPKVSGKDYQLEWAKFVKFSRQ